MKQNASGECLQLPLLDIFNNKYQADDDYFQEISLIIKVCNGKNQPANKQQLKTYGTVHNRC